MYVDEFYWYKNIGIQKKIGKIHPEMTKIAKQGDVLLLKGGPKAVSQSNLHIFSRSKVLHDLFYE